MTPRNSNIAGGELSRAVRRLDGLGALLAEIDAFLASGTIAPPLADRARLVVEELVTNAFHHGGAGGVFVELRTGPAAPEGSVSYAGPAFDPTAPPSVATDDTSAVGGQGLPLIQNLTRSLTYARDGEINRVEFEVSTADDV